MTLASGGWSIAVCDFPIDWLSYFTGAAQRLPTDPSVTVVTSPNLQEKTNMLKSLASLLGAALLLGACSAPPQQAVMAPPPPPPVQAPSFMVFFDWDSSRLSEASLNVAVACSVIRWI